MLGVKAGDLDKMALLFERHSRPLHGFAYRLTCNAALSEDIVQTVFYRMLKYKSSFTGQGSFKTWMYHIARNVINDGYQKQKNMDYTENIALHYDRISADESVQTELETKQSNQLMHKALGHLSYESREILMLSRFQEMTYKEIAQVLETNENNIKIKAFRAMKQLKDIYIKLDNGR